MDIAKQRDQDLKRLQTQHAALSVLGTRQAQRALNNDFGVEGTVGYVFPFDDVATDLDIYRWG